MERMHERPWDLLRKGYSLAGPEEHQEMAFTTHHKHRVARTLIVITNLKHHSIAIVVALCITVNISILTDLSVNLLHRTCSAQTKTESRCPVSEKFLSKCSGYERAKLCTLVN